MFEGLKLIPATLAVIFLGDLSILTGEPCDILASWFLILISSDFCLDRFILLVIVRIFIILSSCTISKNKFYIHSDTPVATILGSH